jgi:hypothetical protein
VNAFKEVQNYDMKEIGNKYLKLFLGGGYIST